MSKVEDIEVYEYSVFRPGKSYNYKWIKRIMKIIRLFNVKKVN
jgi:hypothetical protein